MPALSDFERLLGWPEGSSIFLMLIVELGLFALQTYAGFPSTTVAPVGEIVSTVLVSSNPAAR